MKILYDKNTNIVFGVGNNIEILTPDTCLLGDVSVDSERLLLTTYSNFNNSMEDLEIAEIENLQVPDYFLPNFFKINFLVNAVMVDTEQEADLIAELKKNKIGENDTEYFNKIKYDCFVDENDNIYETSQEFYDFIKSNELKIRNNINNSQIQYSFDNKHYTANQLLKNIKVIENFYQTCDAKRTEVVNAINNLSDLNDIYNFDISSYWPSENQKLNLDGTISNVIINKFHLEVSADKEIIDADGSDSVTVNFSLYYDEDIYLGADDVTWYVPILNIDGNQEDLVEITLNNGEGNIVWNSSKKGIFSFRMDLIRPIPKALMPNNIEIIAK